MERANGKEDQEEGMGGWGRGEERVFSLGKKWKFNQISFYSANRKSVLIKPKGNAKQRLEMETVLRRPLFRGGKPGVFIVCRQSKE